MFLNSDRTVLKNDKVVKFPKKMPFLSIVNHVIWRVYIQITASLSSNQLLYKRIFLDNLLIIGKFWKKFCKFI